jgi:hypothetical protein
MKHFKEISLGTDPEVFVFDTKKNHIISAIGLIGHGKHNPKPLSDPKFTVQEDNVLLEFNTPPVSSRGDFLEAIAKGIQLLQNEALQAGQIIKIQSSAFLPNDQLTHPSANIFGCDPDFNAWTGVINGPPAMPENGLRTAGGHVHVGYTLNEEYDREPINTQIVRWMDLYLGVPSILMDTDKDRRRLYGKAGAHRPKPYGVEYRTLSSFWLGSAARVGWVYDQTMRAISMVDGENLLTEKDGARICKAINEQDYKTIRELEKDFNLQVA